MLDDEEEVTTPARTMSPEEAELAKALYAAVQDFDREKPRAQQSANFVVGISELGFCPERTRRMLAGIPPAENDNYQAFIGTAIGDYVEQAIQKRWPEALRHVEVTTKLYGDQGTFNLTGHPDALFPWGVLDVKTTRGLEVPKRRGPSTQQQYQRHGYALGAWEAGYFGDLPLDEVKVANVWFDRAGDDQECWVNMEKFDPSVMHDAARWLDDVVYAYVYDTEAHKAPPRNVCEKVCGHFATCRALDTDVEGLITDPDALIAVEMYQQGLALEREAKRLKDQAKPHLKGVMGSTGEYLVRWVHVNESVVPETTRKGYDRLSFSRLKNGAEK